MTGVGGGQCRTRSEMSDCATDVVSAVVKGRAHTVCMRACECKKRSVLCHWARAVLTYRYDPIGARGAVSAIAALHTPAHPFAVRKVPHARRCCACTRAHSHASAAIEHGVPVLATRWARGGARYSRRGITRMAARINIMLDRDGVLRPRRTHLKGPPIQEPWKRRRACQDVTRTHPTSRQRRHDCQEAHDMPGRPQYAQDGEWWFPGSRPERRPGWRMGVGAYY